MTTPARKHRILLIEDDRTLNALLVEQLTRMGHEVQGASSRATALEVLGRFQPELAILDLRLPDVDGVAFLPELRQYCAVIVLTAYGSIDQAVEVVRAGASDYLVKPISAQGLEIVLKRFFDTQALIRDVAFWQAQAQQGRQTELIGSSRQLEEVRNLIALFAASDAPVLILGEVGTGKERTAQILHGLSARSNGRLISVDCEAGLSPAELFGEQRDGPGESFQRSEGLIAAAEAGTIYLSDVDRLSRDLQAKLLRAIETGRYRPVGSSVTLQTAARFILSASVAPSEPQPDGQAASELLFRLSSFTIALPPLRERADDIEELALHFLENRSFQRNIAKVFSPAALKAMRAYDWPGNLRELRNAIERGIIMSAGQERIDPAHLGLGGAGALRRDDGEVVLRFASYPSLDQLRDDYLALLLKVQGGNRRCVAEVLGISERSLYRLLGNKG